MLTRREVLAALLTSPTWAHIVAAQQATARGDDLAWLDIATLTSRIWSREISRVEVIDAYLRRIERHNSTLSAYVTVTASQAREAAHRVDARRPADRGRRALDGVPIAHKDLFETAGIRTTAGSRLFDRYVPARDAMVVSKLSAAGAITLGKTNTHELGGGVTTINPFFGTTRNPWDRTRIAGGSSGGSAVAVAFGLAAAATGSDTGGSVRIPAAFCGCVGFKPTHGRLSIAGLLGASPTFDHSGVLARSVTDAWLIYRAAADIVAPPKPSGSGRLRVGVARNFFFDELTTDVARCIETAIERFRSMKADVRDVTFPIDSKTMAGVFDPIVVAEIHARFARDWKARPEAFSKSFAAFFQAPLPTGAELAAAHRALRTYQRAVAKGFEKVDIILTPTVPITAPAINGSIDGALILRNTWPFNAARTPAVSVPCGFDAGGMPIGLQLVAAAHNEETLFRAARNFEQLSNWDPRVLGH